MFDKFIDSLVERIKIDLVEYIKSNGQDTMIVIDGCASLFAGLKNKILSMAVRVLIAEMYDMSAEGVLRGESSEQRYYNYEILTGEKSFQSHIFSKYPVLKRKIDTYSENTIEYIKEIIESYIIDKETIKDIFGIKEAKILDICLESGDSHNGGKTVAIVYIGKEKILYKPHNLDGNIILKKVSDYLNAIDKMDTKLKTVKCLSKENYGWEEYIHYAECKTREEVDNFYYRMGCYLALFSVLGTTDLHFENIIANGEFPIFIDLETIIGNANNSDVTTVINTGLLPQISTGQLIDVDISGIGGSLGTSSKIKNLVIRNKNTDKICIQEEYAKINGKKNLAIIQGKSVDPSDYIEKIKDGFDFIARHIECNKDIFLEYLYKSIPNKSEYRTVLRHTHVYAKYLAATTHPDYLKTESEQARLLRRLEDNCENMYEIPRIKVEMEELKNGDVPCFYYLFDSKHLYSRGKIISDNYYTYTAKQLLKIRIENFLTNIKANSELIKKSLISLSKADADMPKNNYDYIVQDIDDKTLVEQQIHDYLKSIVDTTFFSKNNETVLFYYNALLEGKVTLNIMNLDLYECGGLVVLFAATGSKLEEGKYFAFAKSLFESGYSVTQYYSSKSNRGLNAFSGYGSALYVSSLLYMITSDTFYLEKRNELLDKIEENIKNNKDFLNEMDFLTGLSGFLIVLINSLKNEELYLERIRRLYEDIKKIYLEKLVQAEMKKIGLAHGISGYVISLVKLYEFEQEKYYLEWAKKLLNQEDALYQKIEDEKKGWCNGVSGMCLARSVFLNNDGAYENINVYVQKLINAWDDISNSCLCHGYFGNMYVMNKLNEIGIVSNEEEALIKADTIKGGILKKQKELFFGYNENFIPDTFMTGKSGVYYYYLRNLYPSCPDPMMLEV